MIFFVTVLRALAACLITNSHYTGIYPTDLIANGGLLGDVLFFAVSGFCLYPVKKDLSVKGFALWYGKRLWRVFPPVLIATAVYMLLGFYRLSEHPFVWWYLFPTNYHFVTSILLLYIPFFFIAKIPFFQKKLPIVMGIIFLAYLAVYLFFYDKSYYHIDNVGEPMIRFLFMESMLLGAWFRQNDQKLRLSECKAIEKWTLSLGVVFTAGIYFASKTAFAKNLLASGAQFINQIVLFGLMFLIFFAFCRADRKLTSVRGGGKVYHLLLIKHHTRNICCSVCSD